MEWEVVASNIFLLLQESEEELVILKEEEAKRSAWAEPDISSQVSLSNGTVSSEHNVLQKERYRCTIHMSACSS